MLNVLDLFSGIGGFSLGLEWTGGFRTVAFCEIEPYCQAVLRKHWPDVPIYDDVRTLTADTLRRDGIAVDVICGGFPCQDLSFAGKRAGLEGARSGLWAEYARLIGEVRPRFVIVENVPGLLSLGMGRVLGDLAALGYDAVWDCIPASAVGAPHRRDRVWIVAHASGARRRQDPGSPSRHESQDEGRAAQYDHEPRCAGEGRGTGHAPHDYSQSQHACAVHAEVGSAPEPVANANSRDGHGRRRSLQMGREWSQSETAEDGFAGGTQWLAEPDVGRVAHGVPARVDRLRALGNAVVPQIPYLIGQAILEAVAGEMSERNAA